jgi:hypothetical protein
MNCSKLVAGFCAFVALTLSPIFSQAGERSYFLTHGGQHALILGTVVSTAETSIQFQPHSVISGKQIHSRIEIHYPNSVTKLGALHPVLNAGDRAVVSINLEGKQYKLALGAGKVSSLNPATLKIVESTFRFDDRLMFQWYVNSCGQEKDFSRSGTALFVNQSNGTSLEIARKYKQGWIPLRKASFYDEVCNKLLVTNRAFPTFPWSVGAIAGTVTVYFIYWRFRRSMKPSKIRVR